MACQNHPGVNEGLVVCWRCRREFCHNCAIELHNYYFCANCKTPQVRDLLAGTDMFSLDYAGMDKRLVAWLIDGFLKFVVSFVVGQIGQFVAMGVMGTTGMGRGGQPTPGSALGAIGIILLFSFAGYFLGTAYEAIMLAYTQGQTLGKMAMSIKVVTAEGNPITTKQAWWRSILKMFMYFIGCECMIGVVLDALFAFGLERASLHDLGAKTRVVNK